MEESQGGEVDVVVVTEGADCPATTTTTSFGVGDGACDESSVEHEPKRKKQKKLKKESPERVIHSDEDDAGWGTGIVLRAAEDDDESKIPTAAALEAQHKACCSGSGAGGDGTDENGGEREEIRIQTTVHLSEVVETTTNENEEDEEDEDEDEGELIPEFDPDEKGNSLFTDELRAAVEEGSDFQLPAMMNEVDPSHFSVHGQQLLVDADETKQIATMNGGGGVFSSLTAAPSNGAQDGITDHLDVIAYKIYAALQQASNYPPDVSTPSAAQGLGQYQQPVDQEQGGDKNPVGVDEGERTPRHPRWTREETAVLLAGKRKRDEEVRALQSRSKFTSATERWDSISTYCKAHGVDRDAHQCRKRWSNLAADFKKIRNWHKQSGVESYWSMRGDNRRKNKLPGSFDPEVYADMEATSDCNALKKKKLLPPATAEGVEEHQHDPLASVLESSGRAMQAALARNIQAQIEAHNQNSELDRVQRKEQSDNLVGVLGLLADSLARIAEKL